MNILQTIGAVTLCLVGVCVSIAFLSINVLGFIQYCIDSNFGYKQGRRKGYSDGFKAGLKDSKEFKNE